MLSPFKPQLVGSNSTAKFHSKRPTSEVCRAEPLKKDVFIFGLGYTSTAIGNILSREGWTVHGTTRSDERAMRLQQKGWKVFAFDPVNGVQLSELGTQTLTRSSFVLSSVPPVALPPYDPVLQAQIDLMETSEQHLTWFGYLSSTGVYGDWQGGWVDESSECRPGRAAGILRLAQEQEWLKLSRRMAAKGKRLPVHIFRLAGIYGPARSIVTSLQQGRSGASVVRRTRQRYTSRCHVADIATTVALSMAAPQPGGAVFNVADLDPAPRSQVEAYALQLMSQHPATCNTATTMSQASSAGAATSTSTTTTIMAPPNTATSSASEECSAAAAPPQPQTAAGPSTRESSASDELLAGQHSDVAGSGVGRSSSATEEKRVRAELIRTQLGVELQYPSYREGVAALLAGSLQPFEQGDLQLLQLT